MSIVIALADVRASRKAKVDMLLAALAEMQDAADAGVTWEDLDPQARADVAGMLAFLTRLQARVQARKGQ